MSTTEQMALRLIDAWSLWKLRGAQAICGEVLLPDGTVPVLNLHRMDLSEWQRYKAICAEAASKLTREDVFSCC
jgi:hypothetical protein